jgi:hypothetical protein
MHPSHLGSPLQPERPVQITCMEFFPALCSLQITQQVSRRHQRLAQQLHGLLSFTIGHVQDIVELEGLQACQNLQRLWVVESKVERIGGLDQLQKLTQLFLYSNQIAKIEHLEQLTTLEVSILAVWCVA